ncbi:hypothetical protein FHX52_1049 [Humibacillus xanthopallidus]|uniref:Uncharacterized protein n=1 Tax=Humibacillus xanthopallidus TaxID=412689 RepID=A0A543PV39_9MICO|nr:hypothetical protein [Humibacillus xanthopallidus]TQN47930.1 hypothetical protein FHX52_1049 [Humibacillus xanthopallidus]
MTEQLTGRRAPYDAHARARMIRGFLTPITPYRGGVPRAAWRTLTDEARAAVLDRTAPLRNAPAEAPVIAPSRVPTAVALCDSCGTYFPVRPSRRVLSVCDASACQPSTSRRPRRRS